MRTREWIATVLFVFVLSVFLNVTVLSVFRVFKHERKIAAIEQQLEAREGAKQDERDEPQSR
jgi:hypothetical protein